MKNVLLFLLALFLVWFVWHLVLGLLFAALSLVIKIALIALFVSLVVWVFRMLTGDKQRI